MRTGSDLLLIATLVRSLMEFSANRLIPAELSTAATIALPFLLGAGSASRPGSSIAHFFGVNQVLREGLAFVTLLLFLATLGPDLPVFYWTLLLFAIVVYAVGRATRVTWRMLVLGVAITLGAYLAQHLR